MAQDITLLGASYSAVPAVVLPKTGGGSASFTDVTDTTAAAEDVASGKYFYTASGERTEGTASGGGGYTLDEFVDGSVPTGAAILNTAQSITKYALAYRTGISSISAPYVTTIKEYAFADCTNLESINFPALQHITGVRAFQNCAKLETVAFPSLIDELYGRTFTECYKLATLDLGKCTKVANQSLVNCTLLRTMILRKTNSIATLDAWNANTMGGIYNNPSASTIYVPEALKSSYQSASNWSSAYSAGVTFAKIEGTYYETHYADGTLVPTT